MTLRGQLAPGGDDVDLQDELRSVLQEGVEQAEVRRVALVVLPRQVNLPELAIPLAPLHETCSLVASDLDLDQDFILLVLSTDNKQVLQWPTIFKFIQVYLNCFQPD